MASSSNVQVVIPPPFQALMVVKNGVATLNKQVILSRMPAEHIPGPSAHFKATHVLRGNDVYQSYTEGDHSLFNAQELSMAVVQGFGVDRLDDKACTRCQDTNKFRCFEVCRQRVSYTAACANCLRTHHENECSFHPDFQSLHAGVQQKQAPPPPPPSPGNRKGTRGANKADGIALNKNITSSYLPLRRS